MELKRYRRMLVAAAAERHDGRGRWGRGIGGFCECGGGMG